MQKLLLLSMLIFALPLPKQQATLKGTWEYRGGKFNNKPSPAPVAYKQQRKYTDTGFEAYLLEKGQKNLKYEAGNYTLQTDTCLETQTFCLQAQTLIGKTIRYQYQLRHDTLVLTGKLPSGALIEDYWKKVK